MILDKFSLSKNRINMLTNEIIKSKHTNQGYLLINYLKCQAKMFLHRLGNYKIGKSWIFSYKSSNPDLEIFFRFLLLFSKLTLFFTWQKIVIQNIYNLALISHFIKNFGVGTFCFYGTKTRQIVTLELVKPLVAKQLFALADISHM